MLRDAPGYRSPVGRYDSGSHRQHIPIRLGPIRGLIEGKDVDRIAILALKHARDDFEVSFVLTRFEVGTAQLPKII